MATAVLDQRPNRLPMPQPIRHVTYCGDCGRLANDHGSICQRCSSQTLTHVSRIGHIYSHTVVHEKDSSFALVLTRLATGQLIMGRVADVCRELTIGCPVQLDVDNSFDSPTGAIYFVPRISSPRALGAVG